MLSLISLRIAPGCQKRSMLEKVMKIRVLQEEEINRKNILKRRVWS